VPGGSHVQPILPNPKSQSKPVLFNPLPVNPLSRLQSGSYPGLPQRQIAYSYDGLSRLLSAQYTDNDAASFNYQYTYDLNSNRLTTLGQNLLNPTHSTFDATTYSYNDANQVQTAVDQNGKTAFIYYPDGMLDFR